MKPLTIDIPCTSYPVKTDIYEGNKNMPVILSLIGNSSKRNRPHLQALCTKLSVDLGISSVVFDYSGHGDSPFEFGEQTPAQHFLEVIYVFDWIRNNYKNRRILVNGSSYGGFMATQLTKYREFDGLILRAPAIYPPKDFYTLQKDRDREATFDFRRDKEALAKHPLLARASKFEGWVLLMVHENDEIIPVETTDAYANAFNAEVFIAKDTPHALSSATSGQIDAYNQKISDWLAQATG